MWVNVTYPLANTTSSIIAPLLSYLGISNHIMLFLFSGVYIEIN